MKAIPFFTDTIRIRPHSATNARHCDRPVSLRALAAGRPLALYKLDNGDLRAETRTHGAFNPATDRFIEGPEV